jgi:hypothetical protein
MAGLGRWAAGAGTKKLPGGLADAADGAEGTSGGSMGEVALHTSHANPENRLKCKTSARTLAADVQHTFEGVHLGKAH